MDEQQIGANYLNQRKIISCKQSENMEPEPQDEGRMNKSNEAKKRNKRGGKGNAGPGNQMLERQTCAENRHSSELNGSPFS